MASFSPPQQTEVRTTPSRLDLIDEVPSHDSTLTVAQQAALESQSAEEGETLVDFLCQRRCISDDIGQFRRISPEAFREWKAKESSLESKVERRKKQSNSLQNEVYEMIGFYRVFQGVLLTLIAQSTLLRHSPLVWMTKEAKVGLLTSRIEKKIKQSNSLWNDNEIYKCMGFFCVFQNILLTAMAQYNISRHDPRYDSGKSPEDRARGALTSNYKLMSRLAPFFKKHIEDALEPILGPVASVLESHGEAERKQREQFLALEEKKLNVRREKIQLNRRRGGRCQHRRRASSAKPSRLRIRQGLGLQTSPQ